MCRMGRTTLDLWEFVLGLFLLEGKVQVRVGGVIY